VLRGGFGACRGQYKPSPTKPLQTRACGLWAVPTAHRPHLFPTAPAGRIYKGEHDAATAPPLPPGPPHPHGRRRCGVVRRRRRPQMARPLAEHLDLGQHRRTPGRAQPHAAPLARQHPTSGPARDTAQPGRAAGDRVATGANRRRPVLTLRPTMALPELRPLARGRSRSELVCLDIGVKGYLTRFSVRGFGLGREG